MPRPNDNEAPVNDASDHTISAKEGREIAGQRESDGHMVPVPLSPLARTPFEAPTNTSSLSAKQVIDGRSPLAGCGTPREQGALPRWMGIEGEFTK